MPHRNEQATLFELTACDTLESPPGLPPEKAVPGVTPRPDTATPEGNICPTEPGVFRAVSPWASIPLHEVCAACGREITGSGYIILDYEELGAFCDQDCGDKRFSSYLYEVPEE